MVVFEALEKTMFWILVSAFTYEGDNYTAAVTHLSEEHASFSTKDACEKFMKRQP